MVSHRSAPFGIFQVALSGCVFLWLGSWGCGTDAGPAKPPRAPYWAHSPPSCDPDETREFHCEALMPLHAGRMGPEPYGDCPQQMLSHETDYDRAPPVAVLDPSYTEYMRRRTPPGHSCCYSWCNPIRVAAPNPERIRQSCLSPLTFRERYCISEPEAGSRSPAEAPFQVCPLAIAPPPKAVFSAPEAALFDAQGTSERRGQGFEECCYAWCSEAPPTSGLEGTGP